MRSKHCLSDKKVTTIISQVLSVMKDIFGDDLRNVILYGSYARGEQDIYSDMDIMVLVDMEEESLRKFDDEVFERIYSIIQNSGILLSVMTINASHFYEWTDILPFYGNVSTEGVKFYAD